MPVKDTLAEVPMTPCPSVMKYLSSNSKQIRDIALWRNMYRLDVMLAVHSVLQFALLDKIVDAFDHGSPSSSRVVHQSPRPDLSDKMTKVSELNSDN